MNERIKFKAWDKVNKKMYVVNVICFTRQLAYVDGEELSLRFKDIELLQYTGLKDAKDTEIFEGDILEHWGNIYVVPDFTPLDRSYEAENIKDHSDGSDDWMSMSDCDWEVIGNIYENKELL